MTALGSPSLNQVVAANLKRLRLHLGYTQPELAALLTNMGLPWTAFTVSQAERAVRDAQLGRRFTVEELVALAVMLETTPLYLMLPTSGGVRVGKVVMSREEFGFDVFLTAGFGAAGFDLSLGRSDRGLTPAEKALHKKLDAESERSVAQEVEAWKGRARELVQRDRSRKRKDR